MREKNFGKLLKVLDKTTCLLKRGFLDGVLDNNYVMVGK